MSEFPRNLELEPAAALLANGLSDWLRGEISNSTLGRNRYLDDFEKFRSDLALPYDDPHNTVAQKNRSHHNRLVQWTSLFLQAYGEATPKTKDELLANQMFCAQMYLSGLFRTQCFMQARDQADYYERRLGGDYIGIDLEQTVSNRLNHLFVATPPPEQFDQQTSSVKELAYTTLALNEQQTHFIKTLYESGHLDAGQQESSTISDGMELQRSWVNLVVDYAVFAASEHDGKLSTVPFLEPKSISDDPQIYYPFAEAV
jgi:hypothetical protein